MAKKKAPISSLDVGTSKSAPTVSDGDNIATPNPIRKKISNAKSFHMSLKFAFIREINRLTASVMRKLETTRVGAGSSTASVDSWTPLTPKTKVFILTSITYFAIIFQVLIANVSHFSIAGLYE